MSRVPFNLETIWDIAEGNSEIFNEDDLIEILTAYLGAKTAFMLRDKNKSSPPCYAYIVCSSCDYNKFCLIKQPPFTIWSKEECQHKLDQFVLSFH